MWRHTLDAVLLLASVARTSSELMAYTGLEAQPAGFRTTSLYAIDIDTANITFMVDFNNGSVIQKPSGAPCVQGGRSRMDVSNGVVVGTAGALTDTPLLVHNGSSWCDAGVSGIWGITALPTRTSEELSFVAFQSTYNESASTFNFTIGEVMLAPSVAAPVAQFNLKLSWNQVNDQDQKFLACAMQSGDQEFVAVDTKNDLLYFVCGKLEGGVQVLTTVNIAASKPWELLTHHELPAELHLVHLLGVSQDGSVVATAGWGNGTIGIGKFNSTSLDWNANMVMYPMINHGPIFSMDSSSDTVFVWDASPVADSDGESRLGKVSLDTGEIDFVVASDNMHATNLVFIEE